jgi:hypothetical protein
MLQWEKEENGERRDRGRLMVLLLVLLLPQRRPALMAVPWTRGANLNIIDKKV